jgi:hypothetical protein
MIGQTFYLEGGLASADRHQRGRRMIPDSYETFFLASAGIGGALIGLLFVAISIQPQRTFDPMGDTGELRQRLAEATLLTLTDAFVVSSLALIPDISLEWVNLILGVIGGLTAAHLARRFAHLHQHGVSRLAPSRDRFRVISLSVVGVALFALQGMVGLRLLMEPEDVGAVRTLALVILGLYVLGIIRAWILLGDPRHGWSGWINPLQDLDAMMEREVPADVSVN